MSTLDSPNSTRPNPFAGGLLHKLKNADIEPVKPLSAKAAKAVELLMAEIFSPNSVEITMDGPNDIKSMGSRQGDDRKHHSEIDFGDVETYHEVIDRFLLNFGANPQLLLNAPLVIDNIVVFENPDAPDSPAYVRIQVLTPPTVKVAMVTIVKPV